MTRVHLFAVLSLVFCVVSPAFVTPLLQNDNVLPALASETLAQPCTGVTNNRATPGLEALGGGTSLVPWHCDFAQGPISGGLVGQSTTPASRLLGELTESDGVWWELPPATPRSRHAMIYDPVRDRMICFGGQDGVRRNDVWTLSLETNPKWTFLRPSGAAPSARWYPTAIYDPVRDRMVVFGGDDGSARNDVWALSLGESPQWTQLTPTGTPPTARYLHTAIYDPVGDRMVVFGGFWNWNDVWVLALGGSPQWTKLTPSGTPPSGRCYHTAVCDPVGGRMVVFGGFTGALLANDVWALSLGGSPQWTKLTPSGPLPAARGSHTAIYDPVGDRMVTFGGSDEYSGRNDVWALSLGGSPQWTQLTPSGILPSGRYEHTAVYDSVRDRMVVFGGYDGSYVNDVWALSLGANPQWTDLQVSGPPPRARYSHVSIYEPVLDRVVVFGGRFSFGEVYDNNDVWAFSLGAIPEWAELTPLGTKPTARSGQAAVHDPAGDRMVTFGGNDGSFQNDVWALSLGGTPQWVQLTPSGTPPSGRCNHTAIHDPVRNRMVVFGGTIGILKNDVWALSLGGTPTWTQLMPSGTLPSARRYHTAIYNAERDRMIVFGGDDGTARNDVWALSLGESPQWTQLMPSGTPPSARSYHTAIYDPLRDRMVVFGGNDGVVRNDVWALSLGESPQWTELPLSESLPSVRSGHTATYDPVRDRMVVFGGLSPDTWALTWGTPPVCDVLPTAIDFGAVNVGESKDSTFVVKNTGGGTVSGLVSEDSEHYSVISGEGLFELKAGESLVVTVRFAPTSEGAHDCVVATGTICSDVSCSGGGVVETGIGSLGATVFELDQNHPNPFNPTTQIGFGVDRPEVVQLSVFDARGGRVRRLVDRPMRPGRYVEEWDGCDARGRQVASGVYFYRLTAGHGTLTKKMVFLK